MDILDFSNEIRITTNMDERDLLNLRYPTSLLIDVLCLQSGDDTTTNSLSLDLMGSIAVIALFCIFKIYYVLHKLFITSTSITQRNMVLVTLKVTLPTIVSTTTATDKTTPVTLNTRTLHTATTHPLSAVAVTTLV